MKNIKKLAMTLGLCLVVAVSGVSITGCGSSEEGTITPVEPEPIINALTGEEMDEELPSRPIVVSIDNVGDAIPQSNISQADIIYEFPVEGLQTRLECMFYSQYPEFVGPVRSTRPYFIDMVREYRGAFVGYGWSPDAKAYLHENHVPWINGMVHYELFRRVSDKAAPHNAYIDWENIHEHFDQFGMWDNKKTVKGFYFREDGDPIVEPIETDENAEPELDENGEEIPAPVEIIPEDADHIAFDYRFSHCAFDWDAETGKYGRTVKGNTYIDKETGEQITCENIVVQEVSSKVLDEKGRLEIDMCAGGKAMLFSGGQVIKGTWSRADLDHKTHFYDENGNEFKLSKGKTWVEVVDQNCEVKYEATAPAADDEE